tara:strand:- start:123 stop:350 length:228 start_codon:yes stop_codon:yes gene_type:complete
MSDKLFKLTRSVTVEEEESIVKSLKSDYPKEFKKAASENGGEDILTILLIFDYIKKENQDDYISKVENYITNIKA